MKLAILTLHSQTNYGAILQTYALKEHLLLLGHDVVVLDMWLSKNNEELNGSFLRRGVKNQIQIIIRSFLSLGDFSDLKRKCKSKKFIQDNLPLSNSHFYNWEEYKSDDKFDLIIVGSDQVWNTSCHNPQVYLLDRAPSIPAISYAASFGMRNIPTKLQNYFKEKLSRFSGISVREKQAVHIVSELGYKPTRVVDPTILANRNIWKHFEKPATNEITSLVCYFGTMPKYSEIMNICKYARKNNLSIDLIIASVAQVKPKNIYEWKEHYLNVFSCIKDINYHITATPDDFVNYFSNATEIITSTFHGTMFATIFRKPLRIISQFHKERPDSFERISEFAEDYIDGPVIQEDIKSALESFERGETISYKEEMIENARKFSDEWLKNAIKEATAKKEE